MRSEHPRTGLLVQQLKNSDNRIAGIFLSLIGIIPRDKFERDIAHLYDLANGKDEFWGKDSIKDWFAIWHKSIRQTDYYENCYRRDVRDDLTYKELQEYRRLAAKVREPGYDKHYKGKDKAHLFTLEYQRYLKLNEKQRMSRHDEPINGYLDSILYQTIHADRDNVLYNSLKHTFVEIDRLKIKGIPGE